MEMEEASAMSMKNKSDLSHVDEWQEVKYCKFYKKQLSCVQVKSYNSTFIDALLLCKAAFLRIK